MARCGCSNASGSVGVADSPTLDLSLINGVISGAPILDPATGNLLKAVGAGLRVDCTDIRSCVGTSTPAVFYQSPDAAASFTHNIVSAANTWEQVSELPSVVVAQSGTYLVDFEAAGNATIPATGSGQAVTGAIRAEVSISLYRNGVQVPNTETRAILLSQGAPTGTMVIPSLQLHGDAKGSRVITCNAGDVLTLWTKNSSNNTAVVGIAYQVISNDSGRARIVAARIGA